MAKLDLDKFKENANKVIEEKSTQGLFSDSQKKLVTLELELLEENPFRVRLNDTHIDELSESIEHYGQLEPIVVTKLKDVYQILNGHSRVEAIKLNGGDSAFCIVMNLVDDDAGYYPFLLNQNSLDEFEISYYIDRLLASGIKDKTIQKKLAINISEYKSYNFAYELFDVMQNSEVISYNYLKEIVKIENEALRDETLDHVVQKLISSDEIENYLLRVKEEDIGAKYALKSDGVRIRKSNYKVSIDIDERYLDFDETSKVYDFINELK